MLQTSDEDISLVMATSQGHMSYQKMKNVGTLIMSIRFKDILSYLGHFQLNSLPCDTISKQFHLNDVLKRAK